MKREPVRLLESGELSAAERALLEAGRAVAPIRYDVSAGAARFHAAITGAQVGAAATSAATLTKAGIVVAAALALGVGYYALGARQRTPQPGPAPTSPVVRAPEPARPPASAPVPTSARPSVAPADSAREQKQDRVKTRRAGHSPRRSAARDAARVTTPASAESEPSQAAPAETVRDEPAQPDPAEKPAQTPAQAQTPPQPEQPAESIDELQGIARARVLVGRDPQAALDLLQSVARAHPHGYFIEERSALTILALVGVGQRDAAAMRAEKFLRAHPKSPFADRIRAALDR